MIELYMIRHAESVANLTPELICGQSSDIDLTPFGLEQAKTLGIELKESGIVPDEVYMSPAKRARLTAKYCLEAAAINLVPVVDERLNEVSQGEWENQPRAEKYTPEVIALAETLDGAFSAPGGESLNAARMRALLFMDELCARPGDATIFAFGHGFITRAIASAYLGWTVQETRSHPTPNTSITLFQHDGNEWQVKFVGQSQFNIAADQLLQ